MYSTLWACPKSYNVLFSALHCIFIFKITFNKETSKTKTKQHRTTADLHALFGLCSSTRYSSKFWRDLSWWWVSNRFAPALNASTITTKAQWPNDLLAQVQVLEQNVTSLVFLCFHANSFRKSPLWPEFLIIFSGQFTVCVETRGNVSISFFQNNHMCVNVTFLARYSLSYTDLAL